MEEATEGTAMEVDTVVEVALEEAPVDIAAEEALEEAPEDTVVEEA